MNIREIHENSICKCSPSGDVQTVTISADEYDFLINTAGVENKYKNSRDSLIELDYPEYRELVSAQDNFYGAFCRYLCEIKKTGLPV